MRGGDGHTDSLLNLDEADIRLANKKLRAFVVMFLITSFDISGWR